MVANEIHTEIIGLIKLHEEKMLFLGEWVKRLQERQYMEIIP